MYAKIPGDGYNNCGICSVNKTVFTLQRNKNNQIFIMIHSLCFDASCYRYKVSRMATSGK